MMRYFLILFFWFNIITYSAQINVYENNSTITSIGNNDFNNTLVQYYEGTNIIVNTPINDQTVTKGINATNSIRIKANSHLKRPINYMVNTRLYLDRRNKEIVCYTNSDLASILAFEKFELGVKLPTEIEESISNFIATEDSISYLNPFLEWDIKLKVKFTHLQSGFVKYVDGFYSENFERNLTNESWNLLNNDHKFRVRYAFPNKYGLWKVNIELFVNNILHTEYAPFNINVIENTENKDFVKVGQNKKTFSLNNDLFFPVGQNLFNPNVDNCQYKINSCGSNAHEAFENTINLFADNGSNSFRLLLEPASLDIEYDKIGNYFGRLNYAWEIDNIIKQAENLDLFIDFNMTYHSPFIKGSVYSRYRWDWDDYSVPLWAPDGYYEGMSCYAKDLDLNHPKLFLSDDQAKKFWKQKIRYLINRYGYSTNIYIFELMSEINTLGNEYETYFRDGIVDWEHLEQREIRSEYLSDPNHVVNTYLWQKEMAEYIKNTLGHTEHLLTVSYAGEPDPIDLSYSIPEIDVLGFNLYQNAHLGKTFHYIDRINYYNQQFQKPVLIAETGPLEENACDFGISFKQIAWKLPFTGLAGFNMWVGLNEGTNNENLMRWNELKKVQNFIYNDPEIRYTLMHNFDVYNQKSNLLYDDFSLKEAIYIIGNSDYNSKLFGVILNYSDNYFTNSDPLNENSFCRKVSANTGNYILNTETNQNLVNLTYKQNMTWSQTVLDFNSSVRDYQIDWLRQEDLSFISQTYQRYYLDYYLFHPQLCIVGDCGDEYFATSSILPFVSSASNYAEEPEYYIIQNNGLNNRNLDRIITSTNNTSKLLIQPNPSIDFIAIQADFLVENKSNYTCKITDASGRVLAEKYVQQANETFDTKLFIPGLYYLQVFQNNNLIHTQKWLKSAY